MTQSRTRKEVEPQSTKRPAGTAIGPRITRHWLRRLLGRPLPHQHGPVFHGPVSERPVTGDRSLPRRGCGMNPVRDQRLARRATA
jgi:hypothetical protein